MDTRSILTSVDLFALIERDGVTLRGAGVERYGACPKCGGRDRFHVRQYDGIGYWFCRQCYYEVGGHIWHDAIDYLRWRDGLDYRCAVSVLTGTGVPARNEAIRQPPPATTEAPPPSAWQSHARRFVDACAWLLWSSYPVGNQALTYLRGRGLSDATIRSSCLGLNLVDRTWTCEDWEVTNHAAVTAIAGITIPCVVREALWGVNIRRLQTTTRPKYMKLTGSRTALFGVDRIDGTNTVLVTGGEFDCLLASQFAPQGLGCVTFGSESKRPSLRWLMALRHAGRVVVAYDNDSAGGRGKTRWQQALPRSVPVNVPCGAKDITELWQMGHDLAGWLKHIAQP
jgi:hypothetical protein